MKRIIYSALSLAVVLFVTFPGISQVKVRTVDESNPRYNYPNRPVTIIDRKVGEKSFEKGAEVKGDKSWLRDLRLTLKNTSGKTLIWLWVELNIKKQGKLPTPVSIPLQFGSGTAPLDANGKLLSNAPRAVLKPGETTQLSLSDKNLEYWMKYLKGFDADDIDHLSVEIRYAHYDDGTGWALGMETRQNPNDPNEWIVVPPPEKPKTTSNIISRLSGLLSSLIPPNDIYRPSQLFVVSRLPAGGRFFSGRSKSSAANVDTV